MPDVFDSNVISLVLAGIVGWAAGTIQSWHKARVLGVPVLVPFITRTSRNFTIVVLTLSLLTVGTVVQSSIDQAAQDRCNQEFKRVLSERSEITTEDSALNAEDKNALDRALSKIVEELTTPPDLDTRAEMADAVDRYLDGRQRTNEIQKQNAIKRAENPYPDPQCF